MNNQQLEEKIRGFSQVLIVEKGYIRPVDVLMKLEYLSAKDYDRWCFGKVDFLERVCNANLNKLATVHRILGKIAKEQGLKPSFTVYKQHGVKGKKLPLRFSKTKQPAIERLYATHYVMPRE